MLRKLALASVLVAASSAAVLAHGKNKPMHGGKVFDTGHHNLELDAAQGQLTLHVRHEDDKPEDVSKATANATVLADGKTYSVEMKPAAGGLLLGQGGFTSTKGATVVITLTMPDHKPEQARFKLD